MKKKAAGIACYFEQKVGTKRSVLEPMMRLLISKFCCTFLIALSISPAMHIMHIGRVMQPPMEVSLQVENDETYPDPRYRVARFG